MPVAENVVYMKFTYDLFNNASTPPAPAVGCQNPGANTDVCVSGSSSGLLPNQITKINILHMAMDSTLKGARGRKRLSGNGFGDIGKRTESDLQQQLSHLARSAQMMTHKRARNDGRSKQWGLTPWGVYGMKSARQHSKGFTLIASLLMLLLLSGIAIGLMMMVNTEGKVGGTDLQNNVAYHSAEGGIEKMTSDLAATFQNALSPTPAQICNLGQPTTNGPTLPGVTWTTISGDSRDAGRSLPDIATQLANLAKWGQIASGPNQGLWAQIIPVNMLATAARTGRAGSEHDRGARRWR